MDDSPSAALEAPRGRRMENIMLVARPLLGLAALGGVVAFLGRYFRRELTDLGNQIVDAFGYPGIALGTILADGFQSPIGPQVFMLASIAAGCPALEVLAVICAASVFGGHCGMLMARAAARTRLVRRIIERGKLPALVKKHGSLAFTIASILPVPFSLICYSCGVFGVSYRTFLVVWLIRIPKLFVFYAIIRAGWGS